MNRGRNPLTKLCPHCDSQFVGKLWVSVSGSGFASIVPSFCRARDGIRKERFAFAGDLGHESQMVLFRPDIIVDVEGYKNLHFSYLTKNFFCVSWISTEDAPARTITGRGPQPDTARCFVCAVRWCRIIPSIHGRHLRPSQERLWIKLIYAIWPVTSAKR